MVVKVLSCIILTVIIINGCHTRQDMGSSMKDTLVQEKYLNQTPIASIEGLPNICEKDTLFTIKEGTAVQIYSIGELDVSLFGTPRNYFFKSDAIEISFISDNDLKEQKEFTFSWGDGKPGPDNKVSYIKDGVIVKSLYKNELEMYTYEVTLPWKILNLSPDKDAKISFNAAVGDNDDGIKQHAKIAWKVDKGNLSLKSRDSSVIVLSSLVRKNADEIFSIFKSQTSINDSAFWQKVPGQPFKTIIYGSVADSSDLSATMKSAWDEHNLYLFFKVLDSRRGHVSSTSYSGRTLSDYGWIEDKQGKRVWEMHAAYTKHVGGALKNQGSDTAIYLEPGQYRLKYSTDESHNWNNWDDKPPVTTFYGIRLYKK